MNNIRNIFKQVTGELIERMKLDPEVIAMAEKISSKIAHGDRRTGDEKYEDSLKGLALQYAVVHVLNENADLYQWKAAHATDWRWDIELTQEGRGTVLIDTKGLFSKAGGQYVSRTKREHDQAPADVIYLAFDCREEDEVRYMGYALGFEFVTSKFSGGYVSVNDLNTEFYSDLNDFAY